MSKPTVCQLLHSLTVGGAEVLAADLARRLADRFHFRFACLDRLGELGAELRREGFAVDVVDRRPGLDLGCARRLRRLFTREGVDIVHAHQYTPFFYAALARGLRKGPPLLFTEHGRHFPDYPRRKRIVFNRLALRRTDRVVGVGGAVRKALIDNEGMRESRVGVIYNGVDLEAFNGRVKLRPEVRGVLGVEPDDFLVLQVARLDYLKDHLTAIRAMQRIARYRRDVKLVLVGEGPEQEKIEEEIRAREVRHIVRLAGLRRDVPQLLRASDLFLLSSISEGIPVTVIEAMAAGLPVVSTEVGGVSEVVDAGRTGLLVPAGDDAGLADAILRLASDRDLHNQLAEQGRLRAEQVFSQEKMHDGYRRCYEEMLGG